MKIIGFIGAGNMAEALIRGIGESQLYSPAGMIAADVSQLRLEYVAAEYGIETTTDNRRVASKAETIFLCVKPQNMEAVLSDIAGSPEREHLIVSIAAGIPTTFIAKRLGDVSIIRAMPNTPALIGEGATAVFNRNAAAGELEEVLKLLGCLGSVVPVEDESFIDIVTAVSGSGPAYFFLLMEEMVRSAESLGIPKVSAERLVYQTAKGAGMLAVQARASGESAADLRRRVTSPGGTTEAAMEVFSAGNFSGIVKTAISRAWERAQELSRGK